MKSICLFCSYSPKDSIAEYIQSYLRELKNHFDEVVLITNTRKINKDSEQFLVQHKISVEYYQNEGFDFGMWKKSLANKQYNEFNRIALVNDSNILFKKLDDVFHSINSSDSDCIGLISSEQIEWHLQSFFLVFNEKAIQPLSEYLKQNEIYNNFEEVIVTYEIGLSKYLLKNGLKLESVFNQPIKSKGTNPSFNDIGYLIQHGFPVIKRKLLDCSYRWEEIRGLLIRGFEFNPKYYQNIIMQNNKQIISNLCIIGPSSSKHYLMICLNLFSKIFKVIRNHK